jgi:hypothetical protein
MGQAEVVGAGVVDFAAPAPTRHVRSPAFASNLGPKLPYAGVYGLKLGGVKSFYGREDEFLGRGLGRAP